MLSGLISEGMVKLITVLLKQELWYPYREGEDILYPRLSLSPRKGPLRRRSTVNVSDLWAPDRGEGQGVGCRLAGGVGLRGGKLLSRVQTGKTDVTA